MGRRPLVSGVLALALWGALDRFHHDMDAPVRLKVVRAAAKLSNLVKRILSNQHFDAAALEKNLVDRVAARLAAGLRRLVLHVQFERNYYGIYGGGRPDLW